VQGQTKIEDTIRLDITAKGECSNNRAAVKHETRKKKRKKPSVLQWLKDEKQKRQKLRSKDKKVHVRGWNGKG